MPVWKTYYSESNKELIQGSELQAVHTYETDFGAASAAYKLVLFELKRDNAVSIFSAFAIP